jgi:hypothetical protein
VSTLHVIQYALVSTLYSRRLREAAGCRLCPRAAGTVLLLDPFPVCARFRLAAAARAGGADHEANEVTERKGKRGASECRPRALPPATRQDV